MSKRVEKKKETSEIRRIHIVQGEYHVVGDEDVMLTTLLGSCVSACMRDPVARIGGMNHFLLPEGSGASDSEKLRYGVHAMELLVNAILQLGGQRERLEISLFGGAQVTTSFGDLGGRNADFAEEFVRREGIAYKGGSLRGDHPRRVQFWPNSGRVRQQLLIKNQELPPEVPVDPATLARGNAVELF